MPYPKQVPMVTVTCHVPGDSIHETCLGYATVDAGFTFGVLLPAAKPTGLVEPLKTLEAVLNFLRIKWKDFLRNKSLGQFLIFSETNGTIFSETKHSSRNV